jgi:hypothetical protein
MSEENQNVPDVEAEARSFGWVPEEDFKGNPDEWRDAETFVKRGKEINGFLRKDLEKIQSKLAAEKAAHAAELAEVRATIAEFQKYHNETEARAYTRAIADLKAQKAAAIERGEGALVVDLDEQIDTIKEAQNAPKEKKEEKQVPSGPAPAFTAWVKENLWYKTDAELYALANVIADEVGVENPDLKDAEFLEEITKRVKEAQPEKFTNPARKNANVSSSSDGRSPSTKTKKSYNDLPAEAKAACDKFVKQKLMTQEQYVSEYEWD